MAHRAIRLAGVFVAAAAVLLSTGASQVPTPTPAPTPCDEVADQLTSARLYDKAIEAYNEILKLSATPPPERRCAVAGLQRVFRELLALGSNLEANNSWDEARDLYKKALAIDPYDPRARAGFDRADKASKAAGANEAYESVRSLASAGRHTEAAKKLTAILDKDPYVTVPADLKYLVLDDQPALRYLVPDDQPARWWQFWQQDWAWPFKIALFFLLALALLAFRSRIQGVLHLWLLRRSGPSLDFKDFDKGATDLDIGKTLSALAQQQYHEFNDEGGALSVRLVDGDVSGFTIPVAISSAAPQLKVAEIVSAVLDWVIPSRVLEVSGALQKQGGRGAGLTLTLTEKYSHRVVDTVTLWQRDFGPSSTATVAGDTEGAKSAADPAPFYSLAGVAGYWAVFEVQKYTRERKPGTPKFAPLGTSMWESYAAFRMGVRLQLEDREEARRLYAQAYQRDNSNYGALANLGSLSREDKDNAQAEQLLVGARKAAASAVVGRDKWDSVVRMLLSDVWFKATYLLAATYAYMPLSTGDGQQGAPGNAQPVYRLANALTEAQRLVDEIKRVLSNLETPEPWQWVNEEPARTNPPRREEQDRIAREEEELRSYLRFLKPNAHVLCAAILERSGEPIKAREQLDFVNERDRLNPRVQYNLACYHSEAGTSEDAQAPPQGPADEYQKALEHLRRALRTGGPELTRWAREDPSLEGVRTKGETEFNKIVAKYSPGAQVSSSLPLAGLVAIGEIYAQQLKAEAITTAEQLILRADTEGERLALATKVDVLPRLLLRWARLADLMRIEGIETEAANLLAAADIDSINTLAVQDPTELAGMLVQVNRAHKIMKEPPPPEAVAGWVEDAIHTVPRVS